MHFTPQRDHPDRPHTPSSCSAAAQDRQRLLGLSFIRLLACPPLLPSVSSISVSHLIPLNRPRTTARMLEIIIKHNFLISSPSPAFPIHRAIRPTLTRTRTYQRPHRTMQRMSMVPPKLRVRAFERGIAMRFRLFDTVFPHHN